MKKYTLFLVTALFIAALMAGSTSALDVQPGVDLFETPPGFTEATPALPADFFGPGSDPFEGQIALRGKSFEQDGANLGRTSTIVERLSTATLPGPGTSDTVPIEIIALNLVSVDPITVTYGGLAPELWDVQVNLSSTSPQVQGTMTIEQEYVNGGTFSASLPVTTRFTFIRQADGMEVVLDPAPMDVMETPVTPPQPLPAEACWSYDVDFPIITSNGSTLVNHDGNPLTPHVPVNPSSNFVAGGCGFTAAGLRPTVADPIVDYQQKVMDPETALWAQHGVQPANPLDHFKVYDVDSVVTAQVVTLHDQFDGELAQFGTLTKIDRFANPVDKNNEGIADINSHLVWYRLTPASWTPCCSLTVQNQFGEQNLVIGQAEYLLVPAEKVEPGSEYPQFLDHYKCYPVLRYNTPINLSVSLDDQFGHEDVMVTTPVWFCNPVSKNDEGIISDVDHLVFYNITPRDQYFINITAVDQFDTYSLDVDSSRWLGVPSEKLDWVCDESIVTMAKLSTFAAESKGGAINVNWVTLTEIGSAGFNIHRSLSQDGVYSKINDELIPARGGELQGASYRFIDNNVTRDLTYYYRLEEVDLNGKSIIIGAVSVKAGAGATPSAFKLDQNYPNPFNPTTEITYDLASDCHVRLEIYNVVGQRVATLVNEYQKAGRKAVGWDARDAKGLADISGIYFYRLQAGDFTAVKKMVLLK